MVATSLILNLNMLMRFWSYVYQAPDDECWQWEGGSARGYGRFNVDGVIRGAHVVSWLIANPLESIPAGFHVCHKCDNPSCVNPRHLFVASNGDNGRDMWAKGRARPGRSFGVAHGLAKLDPAKVRAIRQQSAEGQEQRVIARAFGVHQKTIHSVIHRHTWKEVA